MRFTPRVRNYFLAAAGCAGVAYAALQIDVEVSKWFLTGHIPGELNRMIQLSEVVAAGVSVLWIGLLITALDRRGVRLAALAVGQAVGAGLLADIGKLLVGRQRPRTIWFSLAETHATDYTVGDTFLGWLPSWSNPTHFSTAYQSFPSGHAATAVGLATLLALAYPRARWIFASLAILAMLQRCTVQAHFVSDVFAGATLGFLTAGMVDLFRWNRWLEEPAA